MNEDLQLNGVESAFTDLSKYLEEMSVQFMMSRSRSYYNIDVPYDRTDEYFRNHVLNHMRQNLPIVKNEYFSLEEKVSKLMNYRMVLYFDLILNEQFLKKVRKIAELETDILQAKFLLEMNIKLGINKQTVKGGKKTEYIIARAPFYRPDYLRGDITVYMGKTEELGSDLEKLSNDVKFMDKAKAEIQKSMISYMKMDLPINE